MISLPVQFYANFQKKDVKKPTQRDGFIHSLRSGWDSEGELNYKPNSWPLLDFVLRRQFIPSFKAVDLLIARIGQMAEDWLPMGSQAPEELQIERALMVQITAWALAMPALSLLLLMPFVSSVIAFASALTLSALFMLSAGVLIELRSVKLSASLVLGILSFATISITSATGGMSSIYILLLTMLLVESFALSRHFLPMRASSALCVGLALGVALATIALDMNGFVGPQKTLASSSWAELTTLLSSVCAYFAIRFCGTGSVAAFVGRGASQSVSNAPMPSNHDTPLCFVDGLPGLVTRHKAKGEVISVHGLNPTALCQVPGNLLGHGFLKKIHVSDRIAYLSSIDKLRQGQPNVAVDLRFEASEGFQPGARFVPMRANLIAIRNEQSELVEFYIQSQELLASRFSEESEAIDQDSVDIGSQADGDAEIVRTRFLAAVSHELRTPLNSILGFSDVLLHEVIAPLPDSRQRDYVNLIRQSGEHLLNVVNTMLDMSKIQNGHYTLNKEPFDIKDLMVRARDMLVIQAENKSISLTCRAAKYMPEVDADMRALLQIVINLVGNAIKFTNEGGVVSLDAEMRGTDLLIKVSDTGIGIPEDRLAEIGQPFMQVQTALNRDYEGTGLGLALVKGLVSLHDGTFDVQSTLGEGTQFTITIPQLQDEMELNDKASGIRTISQHVQNDAEHHEENVNVA